MKLDLGKMEEDYGGCEAKEQPKKPKKMIKRYPTFYIHDVELKDVDNKMVGKEVTVKAKIRIKEINTRTIVREGKEQKQNDSMDVEVMYIDFGKAPKNFETLQDAIEDGLTKE